MASNFSTISFLFLNNANKFVDDNLLKLVTHQNSFIFFKNDLISNRIILLYIIKYDILHVVRCYELGS